jgi:hypothetical protein
VKTSTNDAGSREAKEPAQARDPSDLGITSTHRNVAPTIAEPAVNQQPTAGLGGSKPLKNREGFIPPCEILHEGLKP